MLTYDHFVITFDDRWVADSIRICYITPSEHGTVIAIPVSGHYGDVIELIATPDTGYEFSGYAVTGATISGNELTFGYEDPIVIGEFTAIDYAVTITQPSNGTITSNAPTAHYGDTVTLSNTPGTGYQLDHYTVNGQTIQGNTFTMPAGNVTISGVFTAITYTISVTQPSHGTVSSNAQTAHYGDTVTLTFTPSSVDWELNYFTVNGQSISGNTFTMPAGNVTVSAVAKAATRTYRSKFYYISSETQFNDCYDMYMAAQGANQNVTMYVWDADTSRWRNWSRSRFENLDASNASSSPFVLTNNGSSHNTNTLTAKFNPVGTGHYFYIKFEWQADHDIKLTLDNFHREGYPSYGDIQARYYTGDYSWDDSPITIIAQTVYTTGGLVVYDKV